MVFSFYLKCLLVKGVILVRNKRPQTYFLCSVTGHLQVCPSHISCLGGAVVYVACLILSDVIWLSCVSLAVLTTQIFVVHTISYIKC